MRTKTKAKIKTQTQTMTMVGLALVGVAGAAAAFGFAMAGLKPPIAVTVKTETYSPSDDIVVEGSSNVHLGTFELINNLSEDINVSDLQLFNCLARNDADGDCADAGETIGSSSVLAGDMLTMRYADSSGSVQTLAAVMSGNEWDFAGFSDLVIPGGDIAYLEIYGDIESSCSGQAMQVYMDVSGTNGSFKGIGAMTGKTMTSSNVKGIAPGARMTCRASEPAFTVSSASPSGTAVPGVNELFRFNVTANAAEDVDINSLFFKVSTTDNAGTNWFSCANAALKGAPFTLYDRTAGMASSLLVTWTYFEADGTACTSASSNAVAYVGASLTPAEVLPAGTTTTYSLYVNSTGASAAADDTIKIEIPLAPVKTASGTKHPVIWSDYTSSGIQAQYIQNLPLTSGTLMY